MVEKLTKGIEETKKEKEKLMQEKENMLTVFKEIEQKAFSVQENYKKTQEVPVGFSSHAADDFGRHYIHVYWIYIMLTLKCFLQLIDKHKFVLDETKAEYNKLKATMDELRAAEVILHKNTIHFI